MQGRKVIVVGGGLAGLAAGISAARAGAHCVLLEATSGLGGRAATRVEDGFCFNMGPHALYRTGPGMEVLRSWDAVPDGRPPPAAGVARRAGRAHALPTGFVSLLTTGLLGAGAKLELGRWLARLPGLETASYDAVPLDEALASMLRREGARELVRALVRLTSYVHAPAEFSAGAALRQLQRSLGGVLYLHGGWRALVSALDARAEKEGVVRRTAARVRSVRRAAGGWRVELPGGRGEEADAVVLALPPRDAARLMEDEPLLARWAAASRPVRAASLDVGLSSLPRPRASFVLGIDAPLYLSAHSESARLAPDGAALVHASRYLAPDEEPDREALRAGLEELLDGFQPGWRDRVVRRHDQPRLTVVHRLPDAAGSGLAGRPGPAVPGQPGLFVAGDWVGAEGMLADGSLVSGREAGRLAASGDVTPGLSTRGGAGGERA